MFDVKPKTSPRNLDCGATCLQMILAYYGIDVDLKTLTLECNTRFIGCSAKDIIDAGEKHDVVLKAYNICADELLTMDRPSIIHWKHNHWCVLCGLNDNGDVVICNPDRGRYPIKRNTFDCFYTGVAMFNGEPNELEAEPTQEDRIEAQVMYTALMTDTLLMEDDLYV